MTDANHLPRTGGTHMKRFVDVSGGAASAMALIRVVERYGKADVIPRFADTRAESGGLYEFLAELERYTGLTITRLDQGVSTWQVFEDRVMWTSQKTGCVASYHLKKVPLHKHLDEHGDPTTDVVYLGLGPDEDDRRERLIKRGAPWQFDFPLCWRPRLGRCDIIDDLRRRGLHPPDAYERGYNHANCNQQCILAGIDHWQKLLLDDPAAYREVEMHELRMMDAMRARGREVCTILKDRRGGKVQSMTLEQLRLETLSGERPRDYRADFASCSCVGNLFD